MDPKHLQRALAAEVRHAFCRHADGSWTCLVSITFDGPSGRIQVAAGSRFYPGAVFMGFDLARWLETQLGNTAEHCP